MALPVEITTSLSSLTPEQLQDMEPKERQALSDQLRRVYTIIESDRIVDEARKATAPKASSSGVLADLSDGRGRQ